MDELLFIKQKSIKSAGYSLLNMRIFYFSLFLIFLFSPVDKNEENSQSSVVCFKINGFCGIYSYYSDLSENMCEKTTMVKVKYGLKFF